MQTTRRSFLNSLAGTAAGLSIAGQAFAADKDAESDPAVSKRTGPFGDGQPITLAGYDYSRVRALIEGQVTVDRCASTFEVTSIGPLNNHVFFGPKSRDVTELGLIPFLLAFANDEFRDYALLPIPVLRLFRHRSIFVRTDGDIEKPEDLRGRKVATVGYSSSGLTHIRGLLEEEYGVKPNEIQWVSTKKDSASNLTGGVSAWEKVRPSGVSIVDGPQDEDESSLLLSGQVDAICHPAEPKAFQQRHPLVRRLFVDHRSVERAFFERTGVFPIMHSVAIRRKSVEAHPWLPKAVFAAYSQAKALDYEYMRRWGWVTDSLPWYGQELDETTKLMGENFYTYGFEACKASYETAVRYVHDQGLSKRKASLEEMFESSSLDFKE